MVPFPKCGKNPVGVFFQQVIDGEFIQLSLCVPCAEAAELASAPPPLLGLLGKLASPRNAPAAQPSCPACGLRWTEFRKTGRLGCAGCYEGFARPLAGLLRRIHGAQRHLGKTPNASPAESQRSPENATRLKELLRAAVKAERFEEAARLRDRLKSMEG
ncbi:MAG: UvrB/UvrC motif-containing protein [Elusimicrobiota bacterium]